MLYRLLAQKQADRIYYGMLFRRAKSQEEANFYNAMNREYSGACNDWEAGNITNEEVYLRLKTIANIIGA
jgi:hypothetical protein